MVGAGLGVELAYHETWADSPRRLLELASLSGEANLPTWWASLLAAACAVELASVARARAAAARRWVPHFTLLAAGFALISADEVAQLHEDLGLLVDGEGIFYFGWVKVAIPLCALLLAVFLPLLRALPRALLTRFLLWGALYVGGAVGMELPLGLWVQRHGMDDLGYSLLDWVEETLELFALTGFLGVLRARHEALVTEEL